MTTLEREEVLNLIDGYLALYQHIGFKNLWHAVKALPDLLSSNDDLPGVPSPDVKGERWMSGSQVPEDWEWRPAPIYDLWHVGPTNSFYMVTARPIVRSDG